MTEETKSLRAAVPHGPETQRAAVLHGPKDLRVEERPVPAPGPGEVLVRIAAVGLCGSDLHYYAHGENGPNVLRAPTVLGHEPSGVVVAAGPGAGHPEPGTPVAVEPAHPCGRCALCRAGRYNLCPRGTCFGSPPTDGALTEYLVVPEGFVHPLPASMDVRHGALIEPLAVAVHAVRRSGIAPGDRVLVTGAGPIGLLVLQVALASGAASVTVSDVAGARLRHAAELGAETVGAAELTPDPARATALADPGGFDVALDCSGNGGALVGAIRALRPGGTAVVVGNPSAPVTELPLAWMQRQEMSLVTAFRYAGDFPAAIALAGTGRIRLEPLVTASFPLDRADAALTAALTDRSQLKVLVEPGLATASGGLSGTWQEGRARG
ncbi:NAD(P)-dependent alcohol dehydrogenase [Streptomyces durmitorensis]|uniref:NAD(P)-dependent alcohol dehydrogenase n=1 Tax=Streptomyces durmitorensis TaxID=319947 RepID=A0ABY4PQZ2_9ACTN|nr:NAD(P)-dependent alcohol dehydrogenase [Streptomyces durmitorensis]UQT55619.1 NAD(P)-dependent alcohol dehydrogenase [Streptomyces durmitorensis]